MIKINLALKKQSGSAAGAKESKTKGFFSGLSSLRTGGGAAALDSAKDLPLRSIAIAVLFGFAADFLVEDYKKEELGKWTARVDKGLVEQKKLKAELAKTKGYDEEKKDLDNNEMLLRTQISVIQKLLSDRQGPPKFILSLSKSTPVDVWLKGLSVKGSEVLIQGGSKNLSLVSDFMKNLSENVYIEAIQLKGSQQDRDSRSGKEVASFELQGRKR